MTVSSNRKLEDCLRGRICECGYDLFAVFSRFEYAMKKSDFHRGTTPNWTKLAQKFPDYFFEKIKGASEAEIIFQNPPRHLIIENGNVGWSTDGHSPNDVVSLFKNVEKIRNNLFHGDKAYNSDRNEELIAAALFVLNEAYQKAQNIPSLDEFARVFWDFGP